MFPATARLTDVYRATAYIVRPAGRDAVLRIGAPPPPLPWGGCRQACFVTACNPFSRQRTASANFRATSRLHAALRGRGLRVLAGIGRGDAGDWLPEPGFLVFGLPRRCAASLGRTLRQNAILHVSHRVVMLVALA